MHQPTKRDSLPRRGVNVFYAEIQWLVLCCSIRIPWKNRSIRWSFQTCLIITIKRGCTLFAVACPKGRPIQRAYFIYRAIRSIQGRVSTTQKSRISILGLAPMGASQVYTPFSKWSPVSEEDTFNECLFDKRERERL